MGKFEIIRGVPSLSEGFSRTIRVFTPERYQREPQERFGVVYLNDGQNVFEHPESARHPTWAADLALERAMASGRIGPWMMVAVDHGEGRFEDYSPWAEPRAGVHGRGERYARFLMEELKPAIDARYRTRSGAQDTAVMGSSLGGLISLYLGWRHPQVFGRVGGLSPSVMWCQDELFRRWDRRLEGGARVYLDVGAEERIVVGGMEMNYGQSVAGFSRHLRALGYGEEQLRVVLEPGGGHSEADWRRRFPSALEWLLS